MTDRLRILLLEDSCADAELTERVLRRSGLAFEAMRVQDRAAFLSALGSYDPDAVLADYTLPQFDGATALRLVRERDADLPFIFVTGAIGEGNAVELLRAGADDYILKDRLVRLPAALERVLEARRQKQALDDAQQALRKSEGRFRAIVENTLDWIWEVDAAGFYTYSSPASFQLLGYRPEELLGLRSFDLMPAEEAERVSAIFAENAAARRSFSLLENVCLRKDGVRVVLETSGSPFYDSDGVFLGYRGVDRDISERKRLDEELAQHRQHLEALVETRTLDLKLAEERSRLILESSADGIYGEDNEGLVTFINPAACDMLGYAPDQVIGRCMHDLVHHHYPDGRHFPRDACPMSGSANMLRVVHQEPLVFWRADGSQLPVAYSSHPMFRNGVVVGRVVSFFDISVQQQAAKAREAALADAERLARLKSEFLANMSHEIRTPLNAVLGFAQVGIRASDRRKAKDFFRRILDSGQLLLGIVNDILDFSKIEAGKMHIERGRVDLHRLVRRAEEQIRERVADKGLDFRVELAPELPATCEGDDLRLAQILANLLSNAVKFTEQGQIRLTLALSEGRLLIRISDTGIGMSQAQLDNLFQPFEQADGSITRRFGGTGLGVAITKRLVDIMDGEIHVESRLGAGTQFALTLPLLAPAGSIQASPEPSVGLPEFGGSERLRGHIVLAAEDNAANRLVLEEMLNQEGCWMVAVSNGAQAVERVRLDGAMAFDLVLMDIQMPVMDGYEATRRIHEIAPELPVVGLTAHAMEGAREQCLAAGMLDHLAKPVELDALVAAVCRHARARTKDRASRAEVVVASSASDSGADADANSRSETWVDWAALDGRYQHHPGFVCRLVKTVLQSSLEVPQSLRQAAEAEDLERLAFLAHSLKGMAGNLFAKGFGELAAAAELSAREAGSDATQRALQLAVALEALLLESQAHCPDAGRELEMSGSSCSDSIDLDVLTQVVARLESLLAADDSLVSRIFDQHESLLIRAFGEQAEQLGREIRLFEFSAALITLRSAWQRWCSS